MLFNSRTALFFFYTMFSICITWLDQYTKSLVSVHFVSPHIIAVVPHINIAATVNTGIAFSWFASSSNVVHILLIIFSMLICISLSIYQWFVSHEKRCLKWGLSLVIGGALGNIIDKVCLGYVIDFIDLYWGLWHFATFNVADAAISLGAICLLLDAYSKPSLSASVRT